MMPKVTDEELNGAANALLGLHARDSSRPAPSPPPIAPPPQRKELDLPKPNPAAQRARSRQTTGWSPSFSSEPPPRAPVPPAPAPAAPISEHQGPAANPYPFYPKPTAAAATPYVEQHGGYYCTNPHELSTRRDFVGTGSGRGAWAQQHQQPGPTTTPPRRRTEWTPRFGPPMTADPRAVMAVRYLPAVDAWTFLQHQQQQPRRSPSPSHHAGPDTRGMYGREYQQQKVAAGGVEACHPAGRDRYQDYAHAAACAATGHVSKYEYPQQHQPYRYEHRLQHPPPEQQQLQQQQHERHEQQPAATTVAVRRREPQQEQPQQPQQPHPQQEQAPPPPQPQQQQQQQQQPQLQQPPQKDAQKQPSINNLWSLIPGTLERQGSSARPGDHNNAAAGGGGGAPSRSSQQQISRGASGSNSDRWFAPDVHLPLTDIARRHRARALARLRARRRALAEAALIPGRPAPVKRHSSDTTNEADSGSDGENEDAGDGGHRSKVFLVEGETGVARVVSGGLSRGVSGGVVRAVSGGSAVGNDAGRGDEEGQAAAGVVLDGDTDGRGAEGVVPAAGGGGGSGKAETAAARAMSNTSAAATASAGPSSSSSAAQTPHATNAPGGNKGGNGSAPSKVGDLFELMRSVTMSFGTGGGGDTAVDGEENLARELGKPVKYRYRQEAARSRKRTRGRFVSEKAPAFVSITELMALRRAERERQQKEEASPVPVSAG